MYVSTNISIYIQKTKLLLNLGLKFTASGVWIGIPNGRHSKNHETILYNNNNLVYITIFHVA